MTNFYLEILEAQGPWMKSLYLGFKKHKQNRRSLKKKRKQRKKKRKGKRRRNKKPNKNEKKKSDSKKSRKEGNLISDEI